jgi:uncharacterized membrane protein
MLEIPEIERIKYFIYILLIVIIIMIMIYLKNKSLCYTIEELKKKNDEINIQHDKDMIILQFNISKLYNKIDDVEYRYVRDKFIQENILDKC